MFDVHLQLSVDVKRRANLQERAVTDFEFGTVSDLLGLCHLDPSVKLLGVCCNSSPHVCQTSREVLGRVGSSRTS